MQEIQIARINALAKKAKTTGLTEAEKAEQQALRAAYVAAVRSSLEKELKNTYIMDQNGNKTPVKKQKG